MAKMNLKKDKQDDKNKKKKRQKPLLQVALNINRYKEFTKKHVMELPSGIAPLSRDYHSLVLTY